MEHQTQITQVKPPISSAHTETRELVAADPAGRATALPFSVAEIAAVATFASHASRGEVSSSPITYDYGSKPCLHTGLTIARKRINHGNECGN